MKLTRRQAEIARLYGLGLVRKLAPPPVLRRQSKNSINFRGFFRKSVVYPLRGGWALGILVVLYRVRIT